MSADLDNYLPIKRSQAFLIENIPLFLKNAKNEFVLYKSENIKLDANLYDDESLPSLFISKDDKEIAVAEIQEALNIELYQQIRSKGLYRVKTVINEIVKEALLNPLDGGLGCLPETIELLFDGNFNESNFLRDLVDIADKNYSIAEHSANVMIFTMNYCIYSGFSADDAKRLSLSALLHDVGKTQIPDDVSAADHQLSDKEFSLNKKHTSIGYDLIRQSGNFDDSIALGALEHHERLDGSGYPMGITKVSLEGQTIGIINSFEYLSFREKSYRKAKKPFDAMSVIKTEVLNEGKFSKEIFVDFCKSLG
jgi:HD-GYP domain-containing protein (c-di-GMP phosphodiesterase class II)